MPIVTIQSPSGQSFQIEAPEGATDDQILRFAKSQGLFDEPQQVPQAQAEAPRELGAGEQISESILDAPGMRAISEMAASANKSIFQFLDFLGPDNVNAVLSLAGSESRVPTLTESFASEGGFMEPGIGRDIAQGLGQLAPVAASAAPAVGRNLASASGIAKEALGLGTAQPVAAGAQLVEEGRKLGVPVLTTDVKPPSTFPGKMAQQTAEKIPLAGTAPVREGQQVMRQRAVQQVADKYGDFSYDAIVNSLKTNKTRIKSAAGNVLEKTGLTLDDVGELTPSSTLDAITNVTEELNKPGVIKSSNAADDLTQLMDALTEPQTFTSLKENRTAFHEIVQSTDKADRSQLTSRAKSLLGKVEKAMTEDMTRFAKTNLPEKEFLSWQKANAVYADQAKNLTKTRLKNVLDKGDVTPETVTNMLFSSKPSEQKLLYNSLTQSGRENARSAIISKVVDNISKRQAGFTPNSFSSELKKYGNQVDIFFKGKEKQQLKGLSRVLEATRRAQDAAVTTPTGQQLVGGLSVTGLYLDPVASLGAAGTVGGLARLYESAPVRNALLKLGSTRKGADTYGPTLLAAQIALNEAFEQESSEQ